MPSIDFSRAYKGTLALRPVDRQTWSSGAPLEGLVSASVERDCTDEYPLLEAGSVELDMGVWESFPEGWYRIEMLAEQGGAVERHPIATLLMSSSQSSIDRSLQTAKIEGSSVLKPAADRLMLTGTYAPKGCDGAQYAAGILRECTPAPIEVEGSFTLDEHAVFGAGISYLQAAWTILKAADWCMRITGDGTIVISEKPTEASLELDTEGRALMLPGAERSADLSEVPNRYYAVDGDEVGEAVNDQGTETSIQARGRYVDYIDESPVKVNGETMTAYARRKLQEMSTVTTEFSYTREFAPDLTCFDVLAGRVEEFGMEGGFRVLKQSLDCKAGITVSETLGREERLFTA